MLIYFLCFVLFLIGLYTIAVKRNLLKIVIGFAIMEFALNLFFILLGYKKLGLPPILVEGGASVDFVDPLPQALVLTSIVVGLATLTFLIALCIRVHEKYQTFDISLIRRLRG